MKKLSLSVILLCLIFGTAAAQDLIIKSNGDSVQAKLLEISSKEIKYKRFNNPDGPLYTLSTSEVKRIKYESGLIEEYVIVEHQQQPQSSLSYDVVWENVMPNQPYDNYKHIYDVYSYVPQADDPYNPSMMGLASFFVPGLGQMLAGESRRGIRFLIGSAFFSSLSTAMFMSDAAYKSFWLLPVLIAGTGLAIDIFAITDAIKVAKFRNMYLRDLRKVSAIKMQVSPYIETVNLGNQRITPVGLSLTVSF
ncbi:MAG: hypothetical protein LBN23_07130 [Paludibacter sp.]|jgi:hypothetical protein|nr:hypothetical protein [Paludibacter sp.]